MASISETIKRQGEIALSITAIAVVVQAVVLLFGGEVPPWPPAAEFEALQARVDGMVVERDSQRCEDWNRRLDQAQMRYDLMPAATFELENIFTARLEIRRIPGCAER